MKVLTTAKQIAKALNFGKYPVLSMNLDGGEGSKCVVISKSSMYGNIRYNCTLNKDIEKEGDNRFYLSPEPCMVKASYGWTDHLKDAEFANAPIVEANQEIAVYIYSPKGNIGFVKIMKTGKMDVHCIVVTELKEIE